MKKIIIHDMTSKNPNETKTVIHNENTKEAKHAISENLAVIGDNVVAIGIGRGSVDVLHCFKL